MSHVLHLLFYVSLSSDSTCALPESGVWILEDVAYIEPAPNGDIETETRLPFETQTEQAKSQWAFGDGKATFAHHGEEEAVQISRLDTCVLELRSGEQPGELVQLSSTQDRFCFRFNHGSSLPYEECFRPVREN